MTGVEIVLLVLAGLLIIAAIGKVLDMHRGGTEVPDPDEAARAFSSVDDWRIQSGTITWEES